MLLAMTLSSGSCDSALIRLSVSPSLKYSFPGSPVAFTKGNTATESILSACGFPRRKYVARIPAAISTTATTPKTAYLLADNGLVTAGLTTVWEETLAAEAPATCPESRSRFNRARSERTSAAL